MPPIAFMAATRAHHVLALEQAGDTGLAGARPPNIKERCEMDLSPGTRATPLSPFDMRAVACFGAAE